MSFKPTRTVSNNSENFEERKYPTPKAGVRPGRISLIVDLGIQEQEDYEDPKTKKVTKRKPVHKVAYFADLTSDVVDYGGSIGEQPYRLALFPTYKGKVNGSNFGAVPPKIKGGLWTFHSNSLHAKLARATGTEEIISEGDDNLDISLLLGKAARFQVEVKERETDYLDDEGNKKIFTDVKFKGVMSTEVPSDPTNPDSPMTNVKVNDLHINPMIISWDGVTEDQIKYLRKDIRSTIKQATNYEGSRMQMLIEKHEGGGEETKQDMSSTVDVSTNDDAFDKDVEF